MPDSYRFLRTERLAARAQPDAGNKFQPTQQFLGLWLFTSFLRNCQQTSNWAPAQRDHYVATSAGILQIAGELRLEFAHRYVHDHILIFRDYKR